jgi:manganese/zinc/iron transport system permease protein
MVSAFLDALLLQAGYNAALVAVGAALLGIAAGSGGTFLFLRKRSLLSDALAHSTLPGVGIAFILMVALGGEGRNLLGLLLGSTVSATIGLLAVDWITNRTRLAEDAAIGAVLSVFFGFGVVLLTVIQTMSSGYQAGLEGLLLGSTAGMLFGDAIVITIGGALIVTVVLLLRRPMTLVAFDPEFAAASGVNVQRVDLAMMGLVMAVTIVGLKLVGLVLIVALLIIPPATARLWSNRTENVVLGAGLIGGVSGYMGAALSASAPNLPTGPIIVLMSFALFALSLLFAPARGVFAALLSRRRFRNRLHRRQGLLALAHGGSIQDRMTRAVLRREGFIRGDATLTEAGKAAAARVQHDERRWAMARQLHQLDGFSARYDSLRPIDSVLTRDQIAEIDRRMGDPAFFDRSGDGS